MRANEFVIEIFQSGKKNWKWLHRGSEEAIAEFQVGERTYQWMAYSHIRINRPLKWEIQFRLIRKPDVDADELDLFGTTGTGNSAEVMSTAVDITRAFLKDYGLDRVEEITFLAKEDSRIGLYAKMIQRLLPNWDLYKKYTVDDGMQFTLTDRRAYDKPENKLSEDMTRRDFLGALGAGAATAAGATTKPIGTPYDDFNKVRLFRDMYVNLPNQINPESKTIIYNKKVYNPLPYELFVKFKGTKQMSSEYIKQVPANSIPGVDEPLMLATLSGSLKVPYSFYMTPSMLSKFKQQQDVNAMADRSPTDLQYMGKKFDQDDATDPLIKNAPKSTDQPMSKYPYRKLPPQDL